MSYNVGNMMWQNCDVHLLTTQLIFLSVDCLDPGHDHLDTRRNAGVGRDSEDNEVEPSWLTHTLNPPQLPPLRTMPQQQQLGVNILSRNIVNYIKSVDSYIRF